MGDDESQIDVTCVKSTNHFPWWPVHFNMAAGFSFPTTSARLFFYLQYLGYAAQICVAGADVCSLPFHICPLFRSDNFRPSGSNRPCVSRRMTRISLWLFLTRHFTTAWTEEPDEPVQENSSSLVQTKINQ